VAGEAVLQLGCDPLPHSAHHHPDLFHLWPRGRRALATAWDAVLEPLPIRLHPDKPNNYNPIYEDDYVEFAIRALETASTPPVVVNFASSERVSVEEHC
jgi:hypothetical protein